MEARKNKTIKITLDGKTAVVDGPVPVKVVNALVSAGYTVKLV